MKNNLLGCFFLSLLCAHLTAGNVKVNSYFQDHMVLQQNTPITVWGTADKGTQVTVSFASEVKAVMTDIEGKWKVTFKSRPASFEPLTLTVDNRSFNDILIGDVWICSGQSNMAFSLSRADAQTRNLKGKENLLSAIRLLNYQTIRVLASDGYTKEEIDRCNVDRMFTYQWECATEKSLQDFSAVATHFGLTLSENLDIPIALVSCAVGGTTINNWIPDKLLRNDTLTAHWYKEDWVKSKDIRKMHRARFYESFKNVLPKGSGYIIGQYPFHFMCEPAFLYEASLGHLSYLHVKGVLWYQGESDTTNDFEINRYYALYELLVKGWRKQFQDSTLPFIAFQLPSYRGNNWEKFRYIQSYAQEKIDHTFLVPTIDQGEFNEIHYRNKKIVGSRAGYLTLNEVYNMSTLHFPKLLKYQTQEDKIILTYNGVGKGIQFPDDKAPIVELLDADGRITEVTMLKLSDNQLTFALPGKRYIKARYAWKSSMLDSVLAFNSDSIPLPPFEIKLK